MDNTERALILLNQAIQHHQDRITALEEQVRTAYMIIDALSHLAMIRSESEDRQIWRGWLAIIATTCP